MLLGQRGHARGHTTTPGLSFGVSCGLSAAWLRAGDDRCWAARKAGRDAFSSAGEFADVFETP